METQTVWVPSGVMHPDLFDGETPVMVPAVVRGFDAHVLFEIGDEGYGVEVCVAARDEDEARAIALKKAKRKVRARGATGFSIDWIDEAGGATKALAEEYRMEKWRELQQMTITMKEAA